MAQLILVNDYTNQRNQQKDVLLQEFETEVICRDRLENTLHLIELINKITGVIIIQKEFKEKDLSKLSEKMREFHPGGKILLSSDHSEHQLFKLPNLHFLSADISTKEFLSSIKMHLKLDINLYSSSMNHKSFEKVDIHEFKEFKISPCNVYLKIFKQQGEKFLLRFKANEEIDLNRVSSYIDNGLEELYVQEKDYEYFKNGHSNKMIKKLNLKFLTNEHRATNTQEAYKNLVKNLKEEGFNSRNIELVDGVIDSISKISKSMSNSNKIKKHLEYLLSMPQKEGYLHNHLTAIVSTAIAEKLSWGSQQHAEKLAFASMFHDIDIIENEKYISIRTNEEISNLNFDKLDIEKVKMHALNSSLFMQDFPKLPLGVESIILQHHGSVNGVGFQEKIDPNKLSMLSLIFMVAEEFSHLYLYESNKINHTVEIYPKLSEKFKHRKFKEILSALAKSFSWDA